MMIYPVRDRVARCPVTRLPVPEDGIEVAETDLYWSRLLRDGDVKTEPTAKAKKADADLATASATASNPKKEG